VTALPFAKAPRENWLAQIVRSPWASAVALAILIAAVVMPPQGLGLPLCQFHTVTHLPCMGCGLTRCFIRLGHLQFSEALFYHPVGALAFPLVLFAAGLLLVGRPRRERIADWIGGLGSLPARIGILYGVLFVTYGLGRMVWVWLSGNPSPW
jgi:hypothetical protein